jgi:hypothetical protein
MYLFGFNFKTNCFIIKTKIEENIIYALRQAFWNMPACVCGYLCACVYVYMCVCMYVRQAFLCAGEDFFLNSWCTHVYRENYVCTCMHMDTQVWIRTRPRKTKVPHRSCSSRAASVHKCDHTERLDIYYICAETKPKIHVRSEFVCVGQIIGPP